MHAPLPEPGSVVWIRQRRWRVERARRLGDVMRLDVADRERRITFLTPFDRAHAERPGRRARRVRRQALLARVCGLVARRETAGLALAAVDANVDILPYQLEAVLAVREGIRRILIADEVGLGKTIQAGLILAELRRLNPALRALIVVPASLRAQWQRELEDKFGLRSDIADRQAIDCATRAGRFGDSPWRRAGVWLVSVDYLRQPHVVDALPFAPWDVVIVDEAHAVCGDSGRHDAVADAARRARHVVLLTATPHSGDHGRFTRLWELGRHPDVQDALTVFRRTRAMVATHLSRNVRWTRVRHSAAETRVFDALMAFEQAMLRAAGSVHADRALLLLSVFRKRALSTMHALGVSLERRVAWLDRTDRRYDLDWIQPPLHFDGDPPHESGDDEHEALTLESGMVATRELTWLRRLRLLAAEAERHESKVVRMRALAARTTEPFVVFTEFRHSLNVLARALGGVREVGILHGGLTHAERMVVLERFTSGRTSALVATDVAAQGLNLQHRARWAISLELPWSPARLEQRIGRVDRLGQARRVHATLLVSTHATESGVLTRLAARALRANDALGDDTFSDFVLPEHAVPRALIVGGDAGNVGEPPAVRVVSATSWRRRAGAAAVVISRRRTLLARWRAPVAVSRRYACAECRRSTRDTVAICSVPILDGAGTVVERILVTVGVAKWSRSALGAIEDRAPTLIARRLSARMKRLARHAARRVDTARHVERAIASYLRALQYPEMSQPQLFNQRGQVARRDAMSGALEITAEHDDVLRASVTATTFTIGEAAIEIVVGPPS